ncbi:Exocyst complex component Sec10 [Musa troglodytarum]|uniref:Exocyst complex component Sec10 n=1 Tax=Musa troglodytarum TaxID=320322 RepID=A0A9E7HFD1_9LILI|nr:Exocyst complex component Sec10 [Musa troglodytarum]
MGSPKASAATLPLILDIDDFKGDFSFDALFGNLVNELLPSFQEHDADGADGGGGQDALPNGTMRGLQGTATPMFPAVEDLLALFKDSCKELVDLRQQIDGRLQNLKKEVEVQDAKHRQTLAELEKGVDGLHQSFQRLDSRISSVGQTAAKIGDHLQSADSQRKTASQTIELIKYLMEFNSSPGDLMELSPLFSDDSRVAEAASIAQKLQLENRLLSRFDAASQRRELSTMAECAKILSQVELYNASIDNHTVRKEAATIMAVFPSPNDVMSILVQYLRIFAVAYEKTEDLAKELQSVGCGDLDAEGLTESLFLPHKDEYPEYEQASLQQLYQLKYINTGCFDLVLQMEELRAEAQQQSESTGTISRSKAAISPSVSQQISVTIVSQYLTEGLERARESLNEAAALRDRFVIGASVSRRVAAAAASAAEAAAAAGESSFRSFMIAVQRCASSVAILQQYFSNTISRLLPPDAHAASLEEMGTAVSSVEGAAQKGLQQCIETVMAEVERLLSAEQKTTDYRTPDDGNAPDHRPTNACIRFIQLRDDFKTAKISSMLNSFKTDS